MINAPTRDHGCWFKGSDAIRLAAPSSAGDLFTEPFGLMVMLPAYHVYVTEFEQPLMPLGQAVFVGLNPRFAPLL